LDARLAAAAATLAAALAGSAGCSGCRNDAASAGAGQGGAPDGEAPASSAPMSASGPGVNATPLPAASVAAAVNPNGLPAYTGPTGSLEGTITVLGDPAPATPADFSKCPEGERTYGKAFREGAALADGRRPLADALVVVTGYEGFVVPEQREAKEVTIEGCAYTARTIDVTFGQRIDLRNKDKRLYAPELASSPMPALMVAPPNGDAIKLYPRRPGYTSLIERMGPSFVQADVYTLLQPLHTVSGLDGHYRLDGVPVGTMTVNVRLRAINRDVSRSVRITAGVVARADVTLEHRAADAGAPADAGAAGDAAPRRAPIK